MARLDAPWAVCSRCGFQRRVNELRKEWTGFRVCAECYDEKPAETRPPRVTAEGLPVPNANPEPPVVERTPAVTGEPNEDDL
jgi:hypothetical protein